MTFSDIFTSSFLDNISSVTLLDMGMALLLAFGPDRHYHDHHCGDSGGDQ